jgi:hypothetical protein
MVTGSIISLISSASVRSRVVAVVVPILAAAVGVSGSVAFGSGAVARADGTTAATTTTGTTTTTAGTTATPTCAQTLSTSGSTTLTTPTSPTPGDPCWTDVEPYPFGYDGNPIDPNNLSAYCAQYVDLQNDPCYLYVTSMAFRSWNRGLAAVTAGSGASTPFGVWRYNGTRWYPDPTFPGSTVCPGNTVLWAGKLDIWLIGGGGKSGDTLCRFDGTTDQWEPLSVPAATLADVPGTDITAGACFAWDDCWFLGTGGAVVHWDGNALSNATPGLGPGPLLDSSPWLAANYTDAVAATNAAGQPFALATAALELSTNTGNPPVTEPDGTPAPQVFGSTGNQFSPRASSTALSSPTATSPGTDLEAVAFDAQGDGWIAGNPASPVAASPTPTEAAGNVFGQKSAYSGPSLLTPISASGAAQSCPGSAPSASLDLAQTSYDSDITATTAPFYLWSSIAAVPAGDGSSPSAIAGGQLGYLTSTRHGHTTEYSGPFTEPALLQVSCDGSPIITRFRVSDPSGLSSTLYPADDSGYVTAVAASAVNDAWAATDPTDVLPAGAMQQINEPPHLYQLTDGQTPDAPAGNDVEPRPEPGTSEPTVFEFAPPVVTTTVTLTSTSQKQTKGKVKKVRLKPAVYDIRKPKLAAASGGAYTLSISFSVRRSVKLGLDALRHGRVVSSSGVKTFSGHSGTLKVRLTRKAWPTALSFVVPKAKSSAN